MEKQDLARLSSAKEPQYQNEKKSVKNHSSIQA